MSVSVIFLSKKETLTNRGTCEANMIEILSVMGTTIEILISNAMETTILIVILSMNRTTIVNAI